MKPGKKTKIYTLHAPWAGADVTDKFYKAFSRESNLEVGQLSNGDMRSNKAFVLAHSKTELRSEVSKFNKQTGKDGEKRKRPFIEVL